MIDFKNISHICTNTIKKNTPISFIKVQGVFPQNVVIFLNSASSAAAPMFDLPLCPVYTHWHRGETETREIIWKYLKKHNI